MTEMGVRPEIEAFDTGHLWLAKNMVERGVIPEPVLVQLCMGVPWGAPDDLPAYAVRRPHESAVEAVCRSIESRTGLRVLLGPGPGFLTGPRFDEYQITADRPLDGGIRPTHEFLLWIPVRVWRGSLRRELKEVK